MKFKDSTSIIVIIMFLGRITLKMARNSRLVILGLLLSVFIVGCSISRNMETSVSDELHNNDVGIYILSAAHNIYYLSDDFNLISDIRIYGGSDMIHIDDGKIYATVYGYDNRAGREVLSIRNGQIEKVINLAHSRPAFIRYNKFNNRAYVGRVGTTPNYISVIDTNVDQEVALINYDEYVKDIVFTADNKMIVSSNGLRYEARKLDIFDLKSSNWIKRIETDVWITSMCLIEENNLIYAVSEKEDEPVLYVVDWESGDIQNIDLSYGHPSRVYINQIGEKEYIYVTHVNENNLQGQEISIIDPITNTVIDEIENVNCPRDIDFFGEDILVCDREKSMLHRVRNNEVMNSVDLVAPVNVVIPQ